MEALSAKEPPRELRAAAHALAWVRLAERMVRARMALGKRVMLALLRRALRAGELRVAVRVIVLHDGLRLRFDVPIHAIERA